VEKETEEKGCYMRMKINGEFKDVSTDDFINLYQPSLKFYDPICGVYRDTVSGIKLETPRSTASKVDMIWKLMEGGFLKKEDMSSILHFLQDWDDELTVPYWQDPAKAVEKLDKRTAEEKKQNSYYGGHYWVLYTGLNESFYHCKDCGKKKDER